MVKRANRGTYYKMSPKHLDRYLVEFGGRLGLRDLNPIGQLGTVLKGMVGKRLTYQASSPRTG